MVDCPICSKPVKAKDINNHIDSGCQNFIHDPSPPPQPTQQNGITAKKPLPAKPSVSRFFSTPAVKQIVADRTPKSEIDSSPSLFTKASEIKEVQTVAIQPQRKRSFDDISNGAVKQEEKVDAAEEKSASTKKQKINAFQKVAPLAERRRPAKLDDVVGQELVGGHGILRSLIEQDRVPSMILWGGPGTGKTTIARVIASMVGSRFVEINSTSSGVAECKKIFAEARGELGLTGRKTIIFCDEIHRFSKSQQDVFLGPVESGQITLIGATTENPSFKVQNALLSRCRTFTLSKLLSLIHI